MKLRRAIWRAVSLAASWEHGRLQLQGPLACTILTGTGSKMAISSAKPLR